MNRLWERRVRLRMVHVKLSNVYSGFSQPLTRDGRFASKCDEVASRVKGQLDLFGVKERQRKLAVTCEEIRHKFGPKAVMRAHDWKLETAGA